MTTIINRTHQLKLYGAALALSALILTLLAVTMAGGAQAQDGPRVGDNAVEYSEPYPCSEEATPDANTVGIIRQGYYAVFDAFWDYEVGHLSNNFCPPEVTVTSGLGGTTYTRADANIHISETAFSVPDSYKVTVVDSRSGTTNGNPSDVTGPTIDIADFPFLAEGGAVSAVKTENGASVFADNSVYWVRLDDPGTTDDDTSPLQVGFSTALLEEADWYRADGDPVQFRFAAVHVLQDGTPQEAHVVGAHLFAFDSRTEDTEMERPLWSNVENADRDTISMQTDQYRPMQFVFTKPGQYLVQVNAVGHVRNNDDPPLADAPADWSPVSPDDSISSPVQWYTFHVGAEADLHTQVTGGGVSTHGLVQTLPITVTAVNSGPQDAENVEVEIKVPPGLSLPATLPAGAVSDGCGVIAWDVGTLASGASNSLTVTSTVHNDATSYVNATAEIRSTTFDPNPDNNIALGRVFAGGDRIRTPFFPAQVTREIVEHAVAGSHAGDPLAAENPEGLVLHYSLSGRCSNKFQVHSNGQIVLAPGQTLDYAKQWEYPLTLQVSDHYNATGMADRATDDSIRVLIRVEDTDPNAVHPTVTFERRNPPGDTTGLDLNHPEVGQWIDLQVALHNLPTGAEPTYSWYYNGGLDPYVHGNNYPAYVNNPGTATYTVHVKWNGGGITASYDVEWFSP